MADSPLVPFNAGKPGSVRLYDYLMGGKDNFAVDREVGAELMELLPITALLMRESRAFVGRAVSYVADQGIVQFIDVGSGMPATSAAHEAVRLANPDARVACVDNDAVVIAHGAALLAVPGRVAVVPGDARSPGDILASPALTALIDTSEPFCLIMSLILDHIHPKQAAQVMAEFRDAMPPGSFLIVSIGTDQEPDTVQKWAKVTKGIGPLYRHSREQVAGYAEGLELVEPGMVKARHWRSVVPDDTEDTPRSADVLGVVARKA
jgi:hypothetical protein